MTLAFFGCLRAGEFCLKDGARFDETTDLGIDCIYLNDLDNSIELTLKRSKTDYLNKGTKLFIGCSGTEVCAVCSMKKYLKARMTHPSRALFTSKAGSVLSKSRFVDTIKLILSVVGEDASLYSGHSFRAGANTSGGNWLAIMGPFASHGLI